MKKYVCDTCGNKKEYCVKKLFCLNYKSIQDASDTVLIEKKVHIVTIGENIKNIICLIDSDTERLKKFILETTDEKARQLWSLAVKYNNSLRDDLQAQLDQQI